MNSNRIDDNRGDADDVVLADRMEKLLHGKFPNARNLCAAFRFDGEPEDAINIGCLYGRMHGADEAVTMAKAMMDVAVTVLRQYTEISSEDSDTANTDFAVLVMRMATKSFSLGVLGPAFAQLLGVAVASIASDEIDLNRGIGLAAVEMSSWAKKGQHKNP